MKNGFSSDLKIIVIGTSGSGKTKFINKYLSKIVTEFRFKEYEKDRIEFWDLAGQDKNAMVTKYLQKMLMDV